MIGLLPLVVLAFASFRVTRFLLFDTLIDEPRNFWYNQLTGGTKLKYLREKLLDLTSCSWCTGFWVTLIIYSVYATAYPWEFTRFNWLSFLGVAGVAGMLHAYERTDDD